MAAVPPTPLGSFPHPSQRVGQGEERVLRLPNDGNGDQLRVSVADCPPVGGGSAGSVPPVGRLQMSEGGCFLETTGVDASVVPLADWLLKLAGRGFRETGRGC